MIGEFSGRYRWLSNFSPAEVVWDQETYPTVEHAYQAAKFPSGYSRECIRTAGTPADAKRIARQHLGNAKDDWRERKVEIMTGLLRQKFAPGSRLAQKLDETEDQEIVEGNTWGDVFWGVCKGRGENMLGKIIMQIRAGNRL